MPHFFSSWPDAQCLPEPSMFPSLALTHNKSIRSKKNVFGRGSTHSRTVSVIPQGAPCRNIPIFPTFEANVLGDKPTESTGLYWPVFVRVTLLFFKPKQTQKRKGETNEPECKSREGNARKGYQNQMWMWSVDCAV